MKNSNTWKICYEETLISFIKVPANQGLWKTYLQTKISTEKSILRERKQYEGIREHQLGNIS